MMIKKITELKEKHISDLQKELSRTKAELIKIGAIKIILFGSAARGDLGLMSDIDLLVIVNSDKNFIERTAEIYKLIQPSEVDILIYTPDEFEKMKKDNLFIQHILKKGKILFERT